MRVVEPLRCAALCCTYPLEEPTVAISLRPPAAPHIVAQQRAAGVCIDDATDSTAQHGTGRHPRRLLCGRPM